MSNKKLYSIGEFSKITGLSPDTIRFYERKQLIHPHHGPRRLRLYTPKQVDHVALLLRLKAAGFTIDEIYTYTTYRGQGSETIPTRVRLMNEKIAVLQEKQSDITASIKYLKEKIKFLENQK
ncbi:MerR family transcriptional regulator [Companilactobacillus musae]|uniref:MerR family transcriptional regulator n=1 Tax=Companilactobacillus musae TaxID=1903258 RepID=UPI000E64E241|nr:MerR family transcriptional regulator [Companilactobacillus musae]